MAKFKHIVTEQDIDSKGELLPIKSLIRKHFTFSSRLFAKLKRMNLVMLNGEPVAGWITPKIGDEISVILPEESSDFPPENIPIYPVYEDDDLLLLNKQPGVIVHPTKGHPLHTIANGLMKYMNDTNQSFKIRFVNRLDMDTSGILVVAKNSHAQDDLTKQMKAGTIEKRYNAVVKGLLTPSDVAGLEGVTIFNTGESLDSKGPNSESSNNVNNSNKGVFEINLPIGRPDPDRVERGVMPVEDGGLESRTIVTILEHYPSKTTKNADTIQGQKNADTNEGARKQGYSLVELQLKTGRTHQIRVHLSHVGYPIVGDPLYGGANPWLIERQALHAYYFAFNHPVTGERVEVAADLPEDVQTVIHKVK